jgi:uncharacterized protein YjdB
LYNIQINKSLLFFFIKMELTGTQAENFDVYYRVHVQNSGWKGWDKNGELAGTQGLSLQVEAIGIVLVDKDGMNAGATLLAKRMED